MEEVARKRRAARAVRESYSECCDVICCICRSNVPDTARYVRWCCEGCNASICEDCIDRIIHMSDYEQWDPQVGYPPGSTETPSGVWIECPVCRKEIRFAKVACRHATLRPRRRITKKRKPSESPKRSRSRSKSRNKTLPQSKKEQKSGSSRQIR